MGREGEEEGSPSDRKLPALMVTERMVRGTEGPGKGAAEAREQVASMPVAAEGPGGKGLGRSEVARSLKSHSHRQSGGVFTRQIPGRQRGVEDDRVESVDMKLTLHDGGEKWDGQEVEEGEVQRCGGKAFRREVM